MPDKQFSSTNDLLCLTPDDRDRPEAASRAGAAAHTRCLRCLLNFYVCILGMTLEEFGQGRKAFRFNQQKINLHIKGSEFEPKAHLPVPGSLDLCFIVSEPLDDVIEKLKTRGAQIIEGPVLRTGANYPIRSIYLRDPDLNLIEISEKAEAQK